jgi:hypothetical protein
MTDNIIIFPNPKVVDEEPVTVTMTTNDLEVILAKVKKQKEQLKKQHDILIKQQEEIIKQRKEIWQT